MHHITHGHYQNRESCLIDLRTSFILTGNFGRENFVTQYNSTGFMRELPSLNIARYGHGCAVYYTNTNQPVI